MSKVGLVRDCDGSQEEVVIDGKVICSGHEVYIEDLLERLVGVTVSDVSFDFCDDCEGTEDEWDSEDEGEFEKHVEDMKKWTLET